MSYSPEMSVASAAFAAKAASKAAVDAAKEVEKAVKTSESASKAASEASIALQKAIESLENASKSAMDASIAFEDAMEKHVTCLQMRTKARNTGRVLTLEEQILSVDETREQVSFLERPIEPISATDVMRLITQLKPERSVRNLGVIGDWLQVGLALKHNESLLKTAGMFADAELMSTFYDVFCMKSPETYPGKEKTFNEYVLFAKSAAITIDTLVRMVKDDLNTRVNV
jgi:hypothetical protein